MSTTYTIETSHLRKMYSRKVAVADLDLQVGQGEVFGFLGPNGAGKTTSIKMLLGLAKPTSGEARLLGQPIGDPQSRSRVGFLPEHFRFHDWLNGTEFLDLHAQLYGLGEADRTERIPALLKRVGLEEHATKKLRGYSKGMLQRVGLAQALLNEPEVVFFDEPMSGLDPIGRKMVRELMLGLRDGGTTVFFSSHILADAEAVCSRVAIVAGGRLVGSGRLADLLEFGVKGWEVVVDHVDDRVAERVKTFAARMTRIAERRYALEIPPAVAPDRALGDLAALGAVVVSLNPMRDTLEDYFMRRVSGQDHRRQVEA
jgi:ABC-2 type transport system ATP-binding protein